MDWDIEPTAFDEYVTIEQGTATNLQFTSDDGFASANPLSARTSINFAGEAVDNGPEDHGALFDFGFGALGAGKSLEFRIFYGAAASEAEAITAVTKVSAEAYSFGQPSTPDGPSLGTPNTFIFAFGGIGGAPVFAPVANADTLTTPSGVAASLNVLANDTDPQGDPLTVTTLTPTAAHGTVTCTAAGACTYTSIAGYVGPDSFTYGISDGTGGTSTGTVTVTVTAGAVTPPPTVTPPTVNKLVTKVSAVSDKSKFKLEVLSPCTEQFSFRIAKRHVTTISQGSDEPITRVSWKKLPKRYKTQGAAHTKTINLSKGRYRAVVTGKCGFVTTTTKSVTLKK